MEIGTGDALLVVDVQNDFIDGSLAVRGAQEPAFIAAVSALLRKFEVTGLPVILTRCWHPVDHISFTARGGRWPPHCVANTRGAKFPYWLPVTVGMFDTYKGEHPDEEQYSGAEAQWTTAAGHRITVLELLDRLGIKRVLLCGIATDYCVRETALALRHNGFETVLITDAIAAVAKDTGDAALAEMFKRGCLARTEQFVRMP